MMFSDIAEKCRNDGLPERICPACVDGGVVPKSVFLVFARVVFVCVLVLVRVLVFVLLLFAFM